MIQSIRILALITSRQNEAASESNVANSYAAAAAAAPGDIRNLVHKGFVSRR